MSTPHNQSMVNGDEVSRLILLAKAEDLGAGDVTTALLGNPNETARFRLLSKQSCVLAGRHVAPHVLRAYSAGIELTWAEGTTDGQTIAVEGSNPVTLAEIKGPIGPILSAERVLLNFLQRLCGVATATRSFVDAVAGTDAVIYDTRKTVPGWRTLDKYAVRCGGGQNHRAGLYDAVLIKDNHLAFASSPSDPRNPATADPGRIAAVTFEMLNRMAEQGVRPVWVEVEAESVEQAEVLFGVLGVSVVLLDNFSLDELRRAVALRDGLGLKGKIDLEASGGIDLSAVRSVAEAGVDRISVGAITHSAAAVDLSLERV